MIVIVMAMMMIMINDDDDDNDGDGDGDDKVIIITNKRHELTEIHSARKKSNPFIHSCRHDTTAINKNKNKKKELRFEHQSRRAPSPPQGDSRAGRDGYTGAALRGGGGACSEGRLSVSHRRKESLRGRRMATRETGGVGCWLEWVRWGFSVTEEEGEKWRGGEGERVWKKG